MVKKTNSYYIILQHQSILHNYHKLHILTPNIHNKITDATHNSATSSEKYQFQNLFALLQR